MHKERQNKDTADKHNITTQTSNNINLQHKRATENDQTKTRTN